MIRNSNNVVTYGLSLNPEPWAMGTVFAARGRGGKGSFTRVSPNKTLKQYQDAVRAELEAQGVSILPGPYRLRFTFSRQLVSYKTSSGKTSSRNVADVTNMQKATEDALQGVVIDNDRDVIAVSSTLAGPQKKGAMPFVIIEIEHSAEYGLPEMTNDWKTVHEELIREHLAPADIQNNDWTP